jgi:hypothetical protein
MRRQSPTSCLYELFGQHSVYCAVRHAFRVPRSGQLLTDATLFLLTEMVKAAADARL